MILVGELSLWIALLMATWCATVSIAGAVGGRRDLIRSGERAAYAAFAFTAFAAAGLWTALLSRDFSLAYVAGQISANVPDIYVFAAFWSAPSGATLLVALMLALCVALSVWANRAANRALMPFVTASLGVVLALLLAASAFTANPFERIAWPTLDGAGMNPQLQSPGMIFHPPTLFLGYAATAVPFAFGIAALATRRFDAGWVASVRRWALASWFFLTIGIVLGMWWAYLEADLGRHWALAPVANASLLPWLTGTALLHSIGIQERKGTLRRWNVVLGVVTFMLAVLGAFVARSGSLESVQSFARSPVGSGVVAMLIAACAVASWLVMTRLPSIATRVGPGGMVSGEPSVARNLRRYGGFVAHAGVVLLLAALAGLAFRREHVVSLTAGQPFEATDSYGRTWRFVSQGISTSQSLNREITAVALEVSLDGAAAGLMKSEKRQYFDTQRRPTFEPSTEAGVREGALQDVYVVLAGISDEAAELRIAFNPFVVWVWVGGAVMALGGLMVMLPSPVRASADE